MGFPNFCRFLSIMAVMTFFTGSDVALATRLDFATFEPVLIDNVETRGDSIVLHGVNKGAALLFTFRRPVNSFEIDKLTFKFDRELPASPVLSWVVGGRRHGNLTTTYRDGGYVAYLLGDEEWVSAIDALIVIFNFSAGQIQLFPAFEASELTLEDKINQLFVNERIGSSSVNILNGFRMFGISFVALLGSAFVVISVIVFLIYLKNGKKRGMSLLAALAVAWMIYDIRFDLDIWTNCRLAGRDAAQGIHYNISNFFPFVDFVRQRLPSEKTSIEFIDIVNGQYAGLTAYLLLPNRLVGPGDSAPYIVSYGPLLTERESTVFDEGKMLCTNCAVVASFGPRANLIKRFPEIRK